MPKLVLNVGKVVYVLGLYRARVVSISKGGMVTCDVYEGIDDYRKRPMRLTYTANLIAFRRKKKSKKSAA